MEAKMMLWLMFATCFWWNSMSQNHFPKFPRHVVNETTSANQVTKDSANIIGPNGYCITVKDGDYSDGNAIILWYCKTSYDADQIWTFESDGTIRSNGKCLTTYANTQGSNIVIYNCDTADEDAKFWKRGVTGVIVSPKTGLALTAMAGQAETGLTLEANIFSSDQTWGFGDFMKVWRWRQILGWNLNCLQRSNRTVLMARCRNSSVEQRWYLYSDGTIRPSGHYKVCLSYDNFTEKRVALLPCGLGPTSQRWVFTRNRTILNERDDLVMEVRDSELREIVVSPPAELPNQEWELFPFDD